MTDGTAFRISKSYRLFQSHQQNFASSNSYQQNGNFCKIANSISVSAKCKQTASNRTPSISNENQQYFQGAEGGRRGKGVVQQQYIQQVLVQVLVCSTSTRIEILHRYKYLYLHQPQRVLVAVVSGGHCKRVLVPAILAGKTRMIEFGNIKKQGFANSKTFCQQQFFANSKTFCYQQFFASSNSYQQKYAFT